MKHLPQFPSLGLQLINLIIKIRVLCQSPSHLEIKRKILTLSLSSICVEVQGLLKDTIPLPEGTHSRHCCLKNLFEKQFGTQTVSRCKFGW